MNGGSMARLAGFDTRLDTPPSINRRHPDSGLAQSFGQGNLIAADPGCHLGSGPKSCVQRLEHGFRAIKCSCDCRVATVQCLRISDKPRRRHEVVIDRNTFRHDAECRLSFFHQPYRCRMT